MTSNHQKIRSYIVENFLFGQDEGLENGTSFLDKGILDSTGVLELVAHLESEYGVKVADSELLPDNLDSIDLICAFIERKQAAGSAADRS